MPHSDCILTFVSTDKQWEAYHFLRRRILFEDRGRIGKYDSTHPDDKKINHHPVLLELDHQYIGAMRIDVHHEHQRAIMRTVAVEKEFRRKGYGRAMLHLSERYSLAQGCNMTATISADDAIDFYLKCGYALSVWDSDATDTLDCQLVKRLA